MEHGQQMTIFDNCSFFELTLNEIPSIVFSKSSNFFIVFPQVAIPEAIRAVDLLKVYPKGILFDVIRKEERVGQHKADFSQEENGYVKVISQLKIIIKVLDINFYKYDYHSQAWWITTI